MGIKKVTVNLPEDQVRFLQDLSEREHMTFTDVLRRAINSEKFFVDQEREGHKILIEDSGQRLMQVIRK